MWVMLMWILRRVSRDNEAKQPGLHKTAGQESMYMVDLHAVLSAACFVSMKGRLLDWLECAQEIKASSEWLEGIAV